jgi:topoisomerase-4 subunit A
VPGPDYPGGGQIISSAGDIADAYRTGRGSLKVRARWKIEDLARGQWQLVVTELPPGVSSQRVLEEIEELTNPKVKAGKKALSQDQTQLKASVLAVLDVVRDESNKDAAVRLVFEPKTSRIEQQELITTAAGAHQPGNLVPDQPDHDRAGRPAHAEVAAPDADRSGLPSARPPSSGVRSTGWPRCWTASTSSKAGRLVLLNIDEVIAIIRQSDEPKAGADGPVQAVRPPGRRHSGNPPAPAGPAGGHQDRAGAGKSCATNRPSWKTFWATRPALRG